MTAIEVHDDDVFEGMMNALIIYDDVGLAVHAGAMLAAAAHGKSETIQWALKPWRLELLNSSPAAVEALSEAADAHLIVLAVHQPESLPAWLEAWLEKWARCRQIQDAAVAVFRGGKSDPPAVPTAAVLTQLAARYGVSFLNDEEAATEEESEVLGSASQACEVA